MHAYNTALQLTWHGMCTGSAQVPSVAQRVVAAGRYIWSIAKVMQLVGHCAGGILVIGGSKLCKLAWQAVSSQPFN